MALRLNTVEYAFPQLNNVIGQGLVQNFNQIVVEIPETTNRTFVSAYADIFTLDACGTNATQACSPTSWSFGLRCSSYGNGTFLNQTVTDTITTSGENMSFHFLFDVSSEFINKFTVNASYVIDASFSIAAMPVNNTNCKLVITYKWDDVDQTRIKTVRIPIESSTLALGTTLANISGKAGMHNIPALNTFCPEASKAFKDIFFETWVNETTTASSAPNPSLGFQIDTSLIQVDGGHEDVAGSARLYRRLWQVKDMNTAVAHEFKANTSNVQMPFNMLGTCLHATYTYYEPDTTSVLNSILLAGMDEIGYPGSTTGADNSRFKRRLAIPEDNASLQQSGLLISFIDSGAVTLNINVGSMDVSQSGYTAYSNVATVVCGGFMFYHNFDASSRKGLGIRLSKQGYFIIDWYTTSQSAGSTGSNVSALMYLNYTSNKSTLPGGSANHAHTVIPLFKSHAADALFHLTTTKIIDIPETNIWLGDVVPVISTYRAGTAQTPTFMTLLAEKDASTFEKAGWEELYVGTCIMDSEFSPQLCFARSRNKFKRWPKDTDNIRMDLNKNRTYKYSMSGSSYFGSYWPITYHTITNYVSGQITGYSGNGSGISVYVHDNNYYNELIFEGSTNIGGTWGFTWYNSSTYFFVEAFEDSTHKGATAGYSDVSLNIDFGSTGSVETSWTF